MLLRSLATHIEEQNWTAIWIDLLIVVVGVFIGIQVSNWNDERVRDRDSKEFTARLTEDLKHEAWLYQSTIEYYDDVLANAERVVAVLEGRAELDDKALLIAAFRATQFTFALRSRATFDELASTGRIDLIKDDDLREAAILIFGFQAYDLFMNLGADSGYRETFRMFIPTQVQLALAEACGDRFVPLGDYEGIVDAMDYPCDPAIDDVKRAAAASIIRENETFLPALRLRYVQLHTTINTLTVSNADIREKLQQIAGREVAGVEARP